MKVIDLLNKIAKGEEPPDKIKVNEKFIYEYDGIDYKSKNGAYLFDSYIEITKEDMNMEIEIIEDTPKEDKKIEKLEILQFSDLIDMPKEEIIQVVKEQRFKINEIIDKINGGNNEN